MKDIFLRSQASKKLVRQALFISQNGRCFHCNKQCSLSPSASSEEERNAWFVLDHVIPLSQGGVDFASNVVGSCWICNMTKGSKLNWKPSKLCF